jgi:hypothetical protein
LKNQFAIRRIEYLISKFSMPAGNRHLPEMWSEAYRAKAVMARTACRVKGKFFNLSAAQMSGWRGYRDLE